MCIRTVSCHEVPSALACCSNIIATSYKNQQIIILDSLTGSQTTVLSGHSNVVCSLAFSSDGTLLVSGSCDKTIKLWDVQTGGVVKTLCGHTGQIHSVSISANNTMIASGSHDRTTCLWNIKTGDCHIIEGSMNAINTVVLSPTNPQLLLYTSNNCTIRQWGIDGHQAGSPVPGYYVAFSPDGTQFFSCTRTTGIIRNIGSERTVVEFELPGKTDHCCFSPDGRFIATGTSNIIYLWDITSPTPCLAQTLNRYDDSM